MKNPQHRGAHDFQILFHGANLMVAHKEGLIGRFASVCALTRQLQNMLILHIMLQDHTLDQIPNQ